MPIPCIFLLTPPPEVEPPTFGSCSTVPRYGYRRSWRRRGRFLMILSTSHGSTLYREGPIFQLWWLQMSSYNLVARQIYLDSTRSCRPCNQNRNGSCQEHPARNASSIEAHSKQRLSITYTCSISLQLNVHPQSTLAQHTAYLTLELASPHFSARVARPFDFCPPVLHMRRLYEFCGLS